MALIYLIASILMALFFLRGLGRYDDPRGVRRPWQSFGVHRNAGFGDGFQSTMDDGIRRSLSGSFLRAIWMVGLWLAIPTFLLSSGAMPDVAALVFALPGGWALAVAIYNVRKRIRGW